MWTFWTLFAKIRIYGCLHRPFVGSGRSNLRWRVKCDCSYKCATTNPLNRFGLLSHSAPGHPTKKKQRSFKVASPKRGSENFRLSADSHVLWNAVTSLFGWKEMFHFFLNCFLRWEFCCCCFFTLDELGLRHFLNGLKSHCCWTTPEFTCK